MYDPDDVELPTRDPKEFSQLPPFYEKVYYNDDTLLSGIHAQAERSDRQLAEVIAMTYGMVSFVDQEIGRVMTRVDELGIRDNTVVIFLSDHGDMMGDHGMMRKGPFHFEELMRIPMIWSWPGRFPEGHRTDNLVSCVDFVPTLLEVCGVANPYAEAVIGHAKADSPAATGDTLRPIKLNEGYGTVQVYTEEPDLWPGTSFVPLLEGGIDPVRDAVIIENDEDYLGLKLRTYVTDQHKMTVYPGQDYGELFDLETDPEERTNLWDDSDYTDLKNRLYAEFLQQYVLEEGAIPRRETHG
jgi:arylsulfatase